MSELWQKEVGRAFFILGALFLAYCVGGWLISVEQSSWPPFFLGLISLAVSAAFFRLWLAILELITVIACGWAVYDIPHPVVVTLAFVVVMVPVSDLVAKFIVRCFPYRPYPDDYDDHGRLPSQVWHPDLDANRSEYPPDTKTGVNYF